MPREVKAYSCEYGCATRVHTSKQRMEQHEQYCKKNPHNRTCATCAYDEFPVCSAGVLKSKPMIKDCNSWKIREYLK